MKVRFKKLNEGARLPKKATEGSAAYDLYVAKDVIIKPGRQVIPLGFAMEMEAGNEALVDPRSGFSSKGMEGYHFVQLDCDSLSGRIIMERGGFDRREGDIFFKKYVAIEPERFDCDVIEGKIDSDYRSGVGVIVHNRDNRTFLIKAGTRIAQMTFHKVESPDLEEVEELSESNRDGGFGSTGA